MHSGLHTIIRYRKDPYSKDQTFNNRNFQKAKNLEKIPLVFQTISINEFSIEDKPIWIFLASCNFKDKKYYFQMVNFPF